LSLDNKGRSGGVERISSVDPKSFVYDRKMATHRAKQSGELTVAKLSHVARSTRDLAVFASELATEGVTLRILDFHGKEFSSKQFAKMGIADFFSGMAEFESDLARARALTAAHNARDSENAGRPPVDPTIKARIAADYNAGTSSAAEIASRHGVARSTVFKIVKEAVANQKR
jgi:DNA invertase Pin-like site-specific DNA recombinase